MLSDSVNTILATHEHLLTAKVATHGQRLLEVLADSNTDFLPVHDVKVFRRRGDACIDTLPAAVIRKANIALALPAGTKHEAPEKRSGRYITKKKYATYLVVLGYEVRGEIRLTGNDDPRVLLCQELSRFFPVPHGNVSFAGTPCADWQSQVVLVNRDLVSLFEITEIEPAGVAGPTAGLCQQVYSEHA